MVTQPAAVAARAADIAQLDADVAECRACPRLVEWREEVARTKRAAFADQTYWGRPVPGFGPADASLAIVGLAPAAHGANRTGRMFTGDRSGDFLYAALHDVGLASQPTAVSADDGLALFGVRITAPVHCAPPANKPTPAERDTCRPWLARELALLAPTLRAVVVLGAFGWQAVLPVLSDAGWHIPRPRPRFGHAVHHAVSPTPDAVSPTPDAVSHAQDAVSPTPDAVSRTPDVLHLFGCFHPSQQNTFTGRLTRQMLRDVLASAASAATLPVRNVT